MQQINFINSKGNLEALRRVRIRGVCGAPRPQRLQQVAPVPGELHGGAHRNPRVHGVLVRLARQAREAPHRAALLRRVEEVAEGRYIISATSDSSL